MKFERVLWHCSVMFAIGLRTARYPPDEIAVRFHHRLVLIHPFPNGNGRHARLDRRCTAHEAGPPCIHLGRRRIWSRPGEARAKYLEALREADNGDIHPLLRFART